MSAKRNFPIRCHSNAAEIYGRRTEKVLKDISDDMPAEERDKLISSRIADIQAKAGRERTTGRWSDPLWATSIFFL